LSFFLLFFIIISSRSGVFCLAFSCVAFCKRLAGWHAALGGELQSGVDDSVRLHGGQGDIGHPEADEDAGGGGLRALRAAELAADRWVAAQHQDKDGTERKRHEHRHREAQTEKRRRRRIVTLLLPILSITTQWSAIH
jgi:hypothetical protein